MNLCQPNFMNFMNFITLQTTMSRVCDICNRGTASGNSRSHSNISTRRKFAINLQSKKVDGQRVKICTKCLKTQSKPKRVRKPKVAGGKPLRSQKTAKKAK